MAQSRRYILVFPTWRSSALIAFFLLLFFFLIPPEYFVKGKTWFSLWHDRMDRMLCSLYGSNSFIYFSSIYSRASRLFDRSKTYLKNNRHLDEVLFVSKLPPTSLGTHLNTGGRKKKKLDPIHLINLFYLFPVCFFLSINRCVRWAEKSRWKIVSRIDLKVQEDDGRCVEYKNWNKTQSDSFVKESQTEKPYWWMERTWQPQSSSIYSSDTHAGTMPSGIDVDVRKSMKLQAKVGRANRQQQRRKMESSGYSGSRGRTLIEGGTVYILIRFCVCVCVRALYSSMVFHCLMRSADVCV
jgi:hypothetical protein